MFRHTAEFLTYLQQPRKALLIDGGEEMELKGCCKEGLDVIPIILDEVLHGP
jgi:hypothetical protein